MGFFGPKKSEPAATFIDDDKPSVIQSLRARFNKGKGKQPASPTSLPRPRRDPGTEPPTTFRHTHHGISPAPTASNGSSSHSNGKPTDPLTLTLTQRLNELAVSNSEGLLTEEEYRILRQNLFERFAQGGSMPTESPVVPGGSGGNKRRSGNFAVSASNYSPKPSQSKNSQPNTPRSIRSMTSMGSLKSSVSGKFRRNTARQNQSTPRASHESTGEQSFLPMSSSTPERRPSRIFRRKASGESFRTDAQTNGRTSVSSRLTKAESIIPIQPQPGHRPLGSMSRSATRSTRRLGSATPPPSAFANAHGHVPRSTSGLSFNDLLDDDNPKSASEIRQHISSVQAEARRLRDSFHNLELTALARSSTSHRPYGSITPSLSGGRRPTESDAGSIRSLNSTAASASQAHSYAPSSSIAHNTGNMVIGINIDHSRMRPLPPLPTTKSTGASSGGSENLRRKTSTSSVSSRRAVISPVAPPTGAAVSVVSPSFTRLASAGGSSVSLARSASNLLLSSVSEVGEDGAGVGPGASDPEVADIQRRKAEVMSRYEARLEFLQAKLKGAELHEKLMRS